MQIFNIPLVLATGAHLQEYQANKMVLAGNNLLVCFWSNKAKAEKEMLSCLSADEQRRARKYLSDSDRSRFQNSRVMLRMVLGELLKKEPGSLVFEYSDAGKPFLPGAVHFNLSHSGHYAACVMAANNSVGVDLECDDREISFSSIAPHVFNPSEQKQLATSKYHQETGFALWTMKEAWLKCDGETLSSMKSIPDMSRYCTPLGPDELKAFRLQDKLLIRCRPERGVYLSMVVSL